MKKLFTFLIAVWGIMIFGLNVPVVADEFISEFHDFNDNQVPAGWTQLIQFGGPGVSDGALRGNTTDGRVTLSRQGEMPGDAVGIRVEYDGNITYSYWGLHHNVMVSLATGEVFQASNSMAQYNYGSVIRVRVGQQGDNIVTYDQSLEYGDYHHVVTFYEDRITYTATRLSDGYVLCDIDQEETGFDISEINELSIYTGTTTDNSAWSDNLSVEILSDNVVNTDFCDDFENASIDPSIWAVETGTWTVTGGTLVGTWPISNANRNVGNILFTDQVQPDGDFTMDIDGVVQPYGNVANGIYMVLYNSFGNKYSIGFNPEGNEIHIGAVVNSGKVPIYYFDNSIGILNTAVGALNHARMVREGEDYSFYINDKFIYTFQEVYFDGDVRLGLQAYGTAVYDNACLSYGASGNNIPPAPALISPTNGTDYISVNPTVFTWDEVVGYDVTDYQIMVATDNQFQNIIISDFALNGEYQADLLEEGAEYFWRMRSFNGQWGDWSEVWSFETGGNGVGVFMSVRYMDENSQWQKASNGLQIDVPEAGYFSNKIFLNYKLDGFDPDKAQAATITYNGKSFQVEYYYPTYLYNQDIPLYYDVYLYPDRQYFDDNNRYLAAFVVTTRTPQTTNSPETILMVHGTCGGGIGGHNVKYWIRSQDDELSYRQLFEFFGGYDVFQFNYPSLQNIRVSATMLGEVVKDIQYRYYNGTNRRKLNVITHSQGGLVARAYTVGMGNYNGVTTPYGLEFKSMIEIAPTNHGTFYGYLGEYLSNLFNNPMSNLIDLLLTFNGFVSSGFGNFNLPATKQQACGSRFLWELNAKPITILDDNAVNSGYMVIAGRQAIVTRAVALALMLPIDQGQEVHDGIVSAASASLLSYSNIPLILIDADHGSFIDLPGHRSMLYTEDTREDIYNIINLFINSNHNNNTIRENIPALTGGDGLYVDLSNVKDFNPPGLMTGIWGSVEIRPTNPNISLINLEPTLLKTTISPLSQIGKLILNSNDDVSVDDYREAQFYDGIGPYTFITRGPAYMPVYSVMEPGNYQVYILGKLQSWSVNVEPGEVQMYEKEIEYPALWTRFVGACPIDLEITTPDGDVINPDNKHGNNWIYWDEDINGDGELDHIVEIADFTEGYFNVKVIPHDTAQSTDSVTLYVITEDSQDTLFTDLIIENLTPSGYAFSTLDTGSVFGYVTANSTPLTGVPVDLYDNEGNVLASNITDDSGWYQFGALDNGMYSVSISTPLGYHADEETKEIEVKGLPHEVNFELTELDIVPQQRSRGYWAHQLHKAIQNKPRDYTIDDFAHLTGLVNIHFNQNLLNPVDFYAVPQPANQSDSLDVLKRLLHMRNIDGHEPFLKRLANAQLMALLLNVASGKVSQTHEISADGRTVSQAITYCDMLVNDEIEPPDDDGPGYGSEWCRYIRASYILLKCNMGLTVPEGMIPADVIQIAYRLHNDNEPELPESFALYQNFPNPFNPITEISFDLPHAGDVKLEIFNIMGQKVTTLLDHGMGAGHHTVQWDASNKASGVYFYKITAGDIVESKKMLLLK